MTRLAFERGIKKLEDQMEGSTKSQQVKHLFKALQEMKDFQNLTKSQTGKLDDLEAKLNELTSSKSNERKEGESTPGNPNDRILRRSSRVDRYSRIKTNSKPNEPENIPLQALDECLCDEDQQSCHLHNSKRPKRLLHKTLDTNAKKRKYAHEDSSLKVRISLDLTSKDAVVPKASANEESPTSETHQDKVCSYCGTNTTPIWRHGPLGYECLCNSCGVKWRRGKILKNSIGPENVQPNLSIKTDTTLTSLFNIYPSPVCPDYKDMPAVAPKTLTLPSVQEEQPRASTNESLFTQETAPETALPKFFTFGGPQQANFFPDPCSLTDPVDRKLYLEEKILEDEIDPYKLAQLLCLVPQRVKESFERAVRLKKNLDLNVLDIDDETWALVTSVLGQ